jgi:aldehyde dehydrogenase (NAD+)
MENGDLDGANLAGMNLDNVKVAQRQWSARPMAERLAVTSALRRKMAAEARELAESIPTHLPGATSRTVADSLVSEVLPLIGACRFLEQEAGQVLKTRRLGSRGRPIWLAGVETEIERVPWGIALILGAGNYPLFLAGVQTLQALVAGNAVLWKPAPGTGQVAQALRTMLLACGLDAGLLTILDESVEAAQEAMAAGVDFVVLTGSAETGRAVQRRLAETLTPSTMELSGCDAVFVLPGADLRHAVRALGFGLRFNGSFTCMAPRRVFLVGMAAAAAAKFEEMLAEELNGYDSVALSGRGHRLLRELINDAEGQGAQIALDGLRGGEPGAKVTLILQATPAMLAMRTEVFAPVLSLMRTADVDEALAANAVCPYALTASIFGPEGAARALAGRLRVGNVLINDLIAPTADPRVAFGGRGRSGFGVTRGAEGLLAMTTPRTVQVQRGRSRRAYEPTGLDHADLFAGLAAVLHGSWLERIAGLRKLVRAARKLG